MAEETSMIQIALQNLVVEVRGTNERVNALTKEMSLLVSNQIEIKELKESVARAFKHIEIIENTHNKHGCPMFRAMEEKRENTIKAIDKEKEEITKRLKELEDKPKMRIENLLKGFFVAAGGGAFTWLITHWKG